MLFRSTLGAVALLFAAADARITGMSVPATIKPGDKFKINLESAPVDPIEDWVLSIAFGYAPVASAKQGTIGTFRLDETKLDDGTYISIHKLLPYTHLFTFEKTLVC